MPASHSPDARDPPLPLLPGGPAMHATAPPRPRLPPSTSSARMVGSSSSTSTRVLSQLNRYALSFGGKTFGSKSYVILPKVTLNGTNHLSMVPITLSMVPITLSVVQITLSMVPITFSMVPYTEWLIVTGSVVRIEQISGWVKGLILVLYY